jgi:hypothetical protein
VPISAVPVTKKDVESVRDSGHSSLIRWLELDLRTCNSDSVEWAGYRIAAFV